MKKIFLMAVAALMATMTFAQAWEWKQVTDASTPEPTDFYEISQGEAETAMTNLMAEKGSSYDVYHLVFAKIGENYYVCTNYHYIDDRIHTMPLTWSDLMFERDPSIYLAYPALKAAPTALENTNADTNADRKVMRNGQLLIIRDGVTYDAQGAIVK